MSRTGRGKLVYINIPYKLYAAILQDMESRERSMSVEHAIQECVRARYANMKVSREYLVRAGREIVGALPTPEESAALHLPKSDSASYKPCRTHRSLRHPNTERPEPRRHGA